MKKLLVSLNDYSITKFHYNFSNEEQHLNIKISFFLFIFLSIFCSNLFSQELDEKMILPEKVGMSSKKLEDMNNYFHSLVDDKKLPGIQTVILRKGELIHFDSYGYADIENNERLTKKSIFRIFSMTKPIVSIALMQLYEQGKFNLHDPIYKYLPEFKDILIYEDSKLKKSEIPIKIIHLLTHTSGYSYGRSDNSFLNNKYREANLFSSKTNREFTKKLSKIPLQFQPGSNWQYGYSTAIIGSLIEVISEKSLQEYLREKIFNPLKMNYTHFQLPLEKIKDFTVGYRWNQEQGIYISDVPEKSRYARKVTIFHAGGGLVSTSLDYIKFCKMLTNKGCSNGKQIISKKVLDLIFTDHLDNLKNNDVKLGLPANELGFGLGFAIRGDTNGNLEQVYGWGGLAGTFFKIDLERDLIYILMMQMSPHAHLGLRADFQRYVESAIIK